MGARVGKGKILLILPKNTYYPGETIKGEIKLKLNRLIKARSLEVTLIGEEIITRDPRPFDRTDEEEIESRRICKETTIVDGQKEYKEADYQFELTVPWDALEGPKVPEGIARHLLTALEEISDTEKRRIWYLKVALDIPRGIDISKKYTINVKSLPRELKIKKEIIGTGAARGKIMDRRAESVAGLKDTPNDEVYAEGIRFCPQCEKPYWPKKGDKQCDRCGAYLN